MLSSAGHPLPPHQLKPSPLSFSDSAPSHFNINAVHAVHAINAHYNKLRRMPGTNLSEYRHMRTGSLNIPHSTSGNATGSPQGTSAAMASTTAAPGAGAGGGGGGGPRFDGARSPPNTSHVPCKFFRQGTCQAGNACPFSHDLGTASETVCKYFAKGNCKFGPKCANIHVLPDGRRINYGKNGINHPGTINLGHRMNPNTYGHHSSTSALTNSFMGIGDAPPYNTSYATGKDDMYNGRHSSMDNGVPTIDSTYSGTTSPYGSPRGGDESNRIGFGLSPVATKGLSVLDAPLPASFDSNGISLAARYGPWPSSVPSKFGIDSPSPSLNSAKNDRTSETLKMLHTSAFGSDRLSTSNLGSNGLDGLDSMMGSSPPAQNTSDEYFGRRAMHSSSTRYRQPRLLSSSAPKVDRDWQQDFFQLEEDYVPSALANELLTPAEKARRGSVRINEGNDSGEDSATKYGSPIGASSPNIWGPPFQRQKDEDEAAGVGSPLGKSLKGQSVFGHVGSPLRNSSLAGGIDMMHNGSSSRPSLAGSRTGSHAESLSALTQQIQRTRLGDDGVTGSTGSSPHSHLHPNAATGRTTSGSGSTVGVIGSVKDRLADRERERVLERHVSSGSMNSSVTGRYTTPIDEEDSSFVFSMEEEDINHAERARKRMSGGMGLGGGPAGWSYASVAGKTNGNGNKGKSAGVESR